MALASADENYVEDIIYWALAAFTLANALFNVFVVLRHPAFATVFDDPSREQRTPEEEAAHILAMHPELAARAAAATAAAAASLRTPSPPRAPHPPRATSAAAAS